MQIIAFDLGRRIHGDNDSFAAASLQGDLIRSQVDGGNDAFNLVACLVACDGVHAAAPEVAVIDPEALQVITSAVDLVQANAAPHEIQPDSAEYAIRSGVAIKPHSRRRHRRSSRRPHRH